MGVRIKVNYEGDLQCTAVHADTGNRLLTDAPVDNQGKGRTFAPTDLVATALGSCMMTIMAIAAEAHQIPFAGATVRVEKEMTTERPRRIARIRLEFCLPESLAKEARIVLENSARHCPVGKSLHPDVKIDTVFFYV